MWDLIPKIWRKAIASDDKLPFTDHLDDVSGNYVDEADLLAARGPLAVKMAYRGNELPGGDLYAVRA